MTTCKSYEAAKIANPESVIYEFGSCFSVFKTAGSKECNPADHCMRYDDFLTIGHRFVDGDAFLNSRGEVVIITNAQSSNRIIDGDEKRFILRAAALEELNFNGTSEYVDPSKQPTKPRTKVEYVKVEDSIFDLRDDFMSHRLFTKMDDSYSLIRFVDELSKSSMNGSLHRRIETEIDERQEFIDAYMSFVDSSIGDSYDKFAGKLYDSGKFKLVEGE